MTCVLFFRSHFKSFAVYLHVSTRLLALSLSLSLPLSLSLSLSSLSCSYIHVYVCIYICTYRLLKLSTIDRAGSTCTIPNTSGAEVHQRSCEQRRLREAFRLALWVGRLRLSFTRRLQYPLIKEYTLNCSRIRNMT